MKTTTLKEDETILEDLHKLGLVDKRILNGVVQYRISEKGKTLPKKVIERTLADYYTKKETSTE